MDYTGIIVIREKTWVDFTLNGRRYRELYSDKCTETTKQKASIERGRIQKAIKEKTFTFADFFPNSKHAAKSIVKTFSALSAEWLEAKAKKKVSTRVSYKYAMNFWNEHFGDMLITEIKSPMIKKVIAKSSIKPKTLKNYLVVLKGTFDDAIAFEWIVKNPCNELDKIEVPEPNPHPIAPDDVIAILSLLYSQEVTVGRYYEFSILTGLRPNEMIAMYFDDFDLVNSRMRVFKGKVMGVTGNTKENTDQWVHISPRALQIVKEQRGCTPLHIKEVFCNPTTKKPWADEKCQRVTWWNPACKKLGIVGHIPYDTRDTYASMMLTAGVPLQNIAKQMSHRNALTTARHYAKIIEGLNTKPLALMNEALESLSLAPPKEVKKAG